MNIPTLSPDKADVVRKSEHFQSLLAHPGFQLLMQEAKSAVISHWQNLLTVPPQELAATQGFIAGVNFMLEYVDGAVRDASTVLDELRQAQAAAFEEARARSQRFQSSTAERRRGVGAEL